MELRQLLCACFSHLCTRLWFVLSHPINLTEKQQAVTMPQSECYAILKLSPSNKFPCYVLIDLHSNSQNMRRNSQICQDTIRRTSSPIPVDSISPTKLQEAVLSLVHLTVCWSSASPSEWPIKPCAQHSRSFLFSSSKFLYLTPTEQFWGSKSHMNKFIIAVTSLLTTNFQC